MNEKEESLDRSVLTRFAWLSIAAAVFTIGLKFAAYVLTGSVGLLSDALESLVNLAGALMALTMLSIAARPADEEHAYGHSKAEYFSSGMEGTLIIFAAVGIVWAALPRFIHPQPLEQVGLGLGVSVAASLANLGVSLVIMRAAKKYRSITLEANAHHLMTDVWTSVGVLAGVGLTALTGWQRLDPAIAILVALNILWTGFGVVKESALGLMDTALPQAEQDAIKQVFQKYERESVQFHALRTRQAGSRRFMSFHVLVPGSWTVKRGHRLLESIEADLKSALSELTVLTHLEPLDDPASWNDADVK